MFTSLFDLKSRAMLALALLFPLMVGCGGSELVNLELPNAIVAGETFQLSVDHVIDEDFAPLSTTNASLVFAAVVPGTWQAQSAQYAATIDGSPLTLPVTISSAPPESSPEFIEFLVNELADGGGIDLGDLSCDATVALREGPGPSDPLIATLFSVTATASFQPRAAAPFNLAAYANSTIYLVSDVGSCLGPNGLFVDNLFLSTGSGNLFNNFSFESGFDGWDASASDVGCINEVLGAGATTAGSGNWTTPAPTDGALLYATDADNPGQCILSQALSVPLGATAATFTGDVGAFVEIPLLLFLDVGMPEVPAGMQLIWFRTDDIADFGDFMTGDTGTLTVDFIANEASPEAQMVTFLHGYYSEVPEGEIIVTPMNVVNAPQSVGAIPRMDSSAEAGGTPVISPLATPGYVGAGLWFLSDSGGQPVPQAISGSSSVLAQASSLGENPIPVLSGFMLILLSIGMGLLGLRRRNKGVSPTSG